MKIGQVDAFPKARKKTIQSQAYRVHLKHPDRRYMIKTGEETVYVIRDK